MLVTFQGSADIGGFFPSIIVSRGILLPPVLAAIPKALPGSFGRLACKRALEFKELENGTV